MAVSVTGVNVTSVPFQGHTHVRGAWRGAKVPLKYPLVPLSLFMSSNKIIVCEEAQASQILSEESR